MNDFYPAGLSEFGLALRLSLEVLHFILRQTDLSGEFESRLSGLIRTGTRLPCCGSKTMVPA